MTKGVELFAPDGPLARALPGYESRAEQTAVAARIAEYLSELTPSTKAAPLVLEAGTGTGKTLAYLAPIIESGRKAVISTGTKTLQDQLAGKDIPLLARALGRPIDFQVMKGRSNYLCLLRAEEYAKAPPLPGTPQRTAFDRLTAWQSETTDGERSGLTGVSDDAVDWRDLSATSDQCRGRSCAQYERCFVTQMRRRAQVAELVIVNHHLYFADLTLRARSPDTQVSLLPEHDVVIFDEAHELDEIAAQHFGVQVSEGRFHELVQDVKRALRTEPALLARFSRSLGYLEQHSRELFDALPFGGGRQATAGSYGPGVEDRVLRLDASLSELESELTASALEDRSLLARRAATLASELAFCAGNDARQSLAAETSAPDDSAPFVRYTDMQGRNRAMVARPIDVSELFVKHLKAPAAIFVSATLRVGESFTHFKTRLGLADAAELAVGSPFDYGRNAALYVPDDLPDPDAPDFVDGAIGRVADLVHASGGGAFVLCTSHRMLQILRARLATELTVLAQGDAPKGELIARFAGDGNAVLLGTMTFWSGVDVAGRALRLVIIDRLPFASPSDPLVAARVAHMKSRGEDAFRGYQLPHAALLLRQGFGRLIRRGDDRGMVAILDRRITKKSYGRVFLRSLPTCPRFSDWRIAESFLEGLSRGSTDSTDDSSKAMHRGA